MSAIDPLALPFDQYQRYTVVAKIADLVRANLRRPSLRVLDVGGYFITRRGQHILPLVHFLPRDRVIAADLVPAPLPNYILADGLALPFESRTFDLVVSCDTLEHVPPGKRLSFVSELLRPAAHYIVLIAPFASEPNRQAERILHQYITSQGIRHRQLEEHLEHGLPCIDTLRAFLEERGQAAVDFADGYLHHWLPMMLIKHTPSLPREFQLNLDYFYNRHLSLGDRREPAYRHVFVIAQPGNEDLLPVVADSLRTSRIPSPASAINSAPDLIHLLKLSQPEIAPSPQVSALQRENARLRHLVEGYEKGRFMRLMRWLKRQRSRLQG